MTTEPATPRTRFREINQICVVVRDIRKAMRDYWETVGIGPWRLYEYGPQLTESYYRGKPGQFKVLAALATLNNITVELIKPLEGDTIHQEFLDQHGEGVHHVAVLVDDIEAEMAAAEANGIAVVQSGRDRRNGGRSGFAYLDTEGRVHTTFEFLQRAGGSPPLQPIEVYPVESRIES